MQNFLNTAQNFIMIKDMSNLIDFRLINEEFDYLDFENNVSNLISVQKNLFDKDIFSVMKEVLENQCKFFLNTSLGIGNTYDDLKITKSWGNITPGGKSHHEHSHPFSVVSGVILLDDNPENLQLSIRQHSPDIPYFIPDRKIFFTIREIMSGYVIDPNDHGNLKNHLILFLSNTQHRVELTDENSNPRRSIAFNTFWRGVVGKGFAELATIEF